MVPSGGGLLQPLEAPPGLPHWLSESDIDVYAGEFRRTGFAGGLNWYRNIDRNRELPKILAEWQSLGWWRCHAALCASSIAPHPTRSPCYSRLIRFWTVGGLRLNRLSGARYSSWMSSLLHCSTRIAPFSSFTTINAIPVARRAGTSLPRDLGWGPGSSPTCPGPGSHAGRPRRRYPSLVTLEDPNIEPQRRLALRRVPGGQRVRDIHARRSSAHHRNCRGIASPPIRRSGAFRIRMCAGTCRLYGGQYFTLCRVRLGAAESRPRRRRFPSARRDAALRTQRRPPRRIGGRPRARATDRSAHPPGR